MSTTTKILIGASLSFVLLISGIVVYIISAKFTGERFEQSILAQDESMQNTWAMTSNEAKMAGLTVKNFTESDIKKLEIGIQRYADKPQMMIQWAQEQGNTLTPDVHKKFMDIISKISAKKEARQLSKISVVQEYRTWRNASLKGFIGTTLFNFPSNAVKTIEDRIITTKETKETWQTGEDNLENPFKG